MTSKYGTVATPEHGTLILTQQPYLNGGTIRVPAVGRYEGAWYEAHAENADGDEYRVIWTDIDLDVDDEADAADWDHPNYVLTA